MKIQIRMLLIAIISVMFIFGIGVMIAEQSIVGIIACILLSIGTIGYGFATKAKLRRQQQKQ